MGAVILRKFFKHTFGKKFRIVNVFSLTENKDALV